MVYLIAAQAKNRVIGDHGTIPWKLPADVQFFRQKIRGQTVLMGRRVYDSFLDVTKIAARSLVLTSQADGLPADVTAVKSVDQAIKLAGQNDLYVIGGGQTYLAALPQADAVYLTEIDHDYPGDVVFPELPDSDWQLESSQPGHDDSFEFSFKFNLYRRRGA